jgi:aminoglycoside phosphotransferase (APT) family kinase protein
VSVETQYRAMAAVAAQNAAPVPACVGYEPDPSLLGSPFFVMRFIAGRVPADQPRYSQTGFLVDEATPDDRRRMVRSGLAAMAGIHGIDWRTAGLDWLDISGDGSPTMAHQLRLYRGFSATQLAGRDHPVLSAALDWLEMNDPLDERIGLSWGDARLGNIIWNDYRPAAVVDWEACAICPTEADIGWWLMFDRMSFDDMGVPRLEGFPTREEMIAHYEAVSGREVRAPHYWEVFATMRFAAIFIPLADRMVGTGLMPASLNAAVANQVTDALARLLGIDNPTPAAF